MIGKQPVEILYFMLVQAISMTVSYRHILSEFGAGVDDIAKLKAGVMQCIYGTFLEGNDARMTAKEDVRRFATTPGRRKESVHKRTAPR